MWRRSWKRQAMPCFSLKRRQMRSKFEGYQGPPCGAASTRLESVQPGSLRRRFLACSARWARRASTLLGEVDEVARLLAEWAES